MTLGSRTSAVLSSSPTDNAHTAGGRERARQSRGQVLAERERHSAHRARMWHASDVGLPGGDSFSWGRQRATCMWGQTSRRCRHRAQLVTLHASDAPVRPAGTPPGGCACGLRARRSAAPCHATRVRCECYRRVRLRSVRVWVSVCIRVRESATPPRAQAHRWPTRHPANAAPRAGPRHPHTLDPSSPSHRAAHRRSTVLSTRTRLTSHRVGAGSTCV